MKTLERIRRRLAGGRRPAPAAEPPPPVFQNPNLADPDAVSFGDWPRSQVASEPYRFHRVELPGGIVTPGWSDPRVDKLPYYGLPDDLTGMRVLDIGHAEGFFSFESERRGAAEVVAVENYPPMVRKFNICRTALGSRAQSFLASVYDLSPKTFGTFDLVLFFGVLYHLRHPLLALEKIHGVCAGTLLMQTEASYDGGEKPVAEFHPFGVRSGPPENPSHDPTCFWFPNPACCAAMPEHAGFGQIERLSPAAPIGAAFRARAAVQAKGERPDETKAPWS